MGPPPASVVFTITSDTQPTLTFDVPQSPTPDAYVSGDYFQLYNIPIAANGSPAGLDDFTFYSSANLGGFADFYFNYEGGAYGPQLYSGTEEYPTFLLGTFAFSYTDFPTGEDPGGSVTISAETPLPSTWTMLIAGFVGLGFFAYRGSKKNGSAIAAA